jgi:hypothetical protein
MLIVSALRTQLGSLVRSAAAVLFPSIAVLEDDAPEIAILLYLLETVLWSALLFGRSVVNLFVLQRAGGSAGASRQISQLRLARELTWVTLLIGAVLLPLLGMGLFAVRGGSWEQQWHMLVERARWLSLLVLASAVLDTLIAPVRSQLWLQTAVAQQMTRLFVLHPVVMFGFVLYNLTGSTAGIIAIFFTVRILVDISGWRRANRQARRARWFGRLTEDEPQVVRAARVS